MFNIKKRPRPLGSPSVAVSHAAAQKQAFDFLQKQNDERRTVNEQRLRAVALKCAAMRNLLPRATLDLADKYYAWLLNGTPTEADL